MVKAHWVKFAPSDFLNGVVDLNPEQIGAYITVLSLIWDRGGPIPDDETWIARRLGCARLKWRNLRAQLLELGKIHLDENGMITNRRAMQEVHRIEKLRETRAAAAGERWAKGDADLFEGGSGQKTAGNRQSGDAFASGGRSPVDNPKPPPKPPGKNEGNPPEKRGGLPQENPANALKTNEPGDANAFFPSRAHARELELDKNNTNDQLSNAARGEAGNGSPSDDRSPGLYDLTIACTDAAGMSARIASRPALLTQSLEIVKGWQRSGIDIQKTAVPVITQAFDRMNEPAHSLAKFSPAIDTHHAKAKRHVERVGAPMPAPATPVFEFADEAQPILQFRTQLAQQIGRANYSQFCKAVAFRVTDWREDGDRQALQIAPREGQASRVWEPGFIMERFGEPIRNLAKALLGTPMVLQAMHPNPSFKPQSEAKP